jgi:hypothetical protein
MQDSMRRLLEPGELALDGEPSGSDRGRPDDDGKNAEKKEERAGRTRGQAREPVVFVVLETRLIPVEE